MADLYVSTDGGVYSANQSSWANAHGISSGTAVHDDDESGVQTVAGVYRNTSRGAAHRVHRLFFYFDTSGISGTVSSATLKLYGNDPQGTETTKNVIAVESTAFGGDGDDVLHNDDINNIDISTPYSSATTSWSNSGYNDLTLNATAKGHMASQDYLIVAVLNYEYDYSNTEAGADASYSNGIYFVDEAGTGKDPYIDYTIATGYGHDICGLAAASIGKVSSLATANIGKVSGT